jgi:plastocyanin
MRIKLFVLGCTALLAVITMVGSRAQATVTPVEDKPAIVTVKMINFTYSPDPLTIPAGTTVRWVNYDDDQHNVVSDDKSFKSKLLDKNQDYSYTFAKKGTYRYICSIHPKMIGKVIVE